MKSQFANFDDFLMAVEQARRANLDLHVDAKSVTMSRSILTYVTDDRLRVDDGAGGYSFPINNICHRQIAEKCGIPWKYYEKMIEVPGLRAVNVNGWIEKQNEVHFLRVQNGTARAWLSNSYMPIDHFPLLRDTIIPVLEMFKDQIEFRAMAVSPANMFIQAQIPNMVKQLKKGDLVGWGFGFRNSEVGLGAYDAYSMAWELACINGRVVESMLKRYHVGRRIAPEESVKIYREETIAADLNALKLKIIDVLVDAMKGEQFEKEIQKMNNAGLDVIPDNDVKKVVENVTRRYGLSDMEGESVLATMWKRNDHTRYGLHNGITALAHKNDDPDRSFEYEKIGTQIIELNPSQWQVLQKVA